MRHFKNFPVLFLVLSLTLALSLLGCGGNDAPTMTGQFIDSPVSGLTFETETQEGSTDIEGSFIYFDGESISFFLGDIFLGKATAKPVISPLDLIGGAVEAVEPEHPAVTNICRLLQTLDEDGNPDNGIAIGEKALERAAGLSLDFDVPVAQFEENLDADETLTGLLAFGDGNRLKLVSPEAAQRHLRKSLGMEIAQVSDEDSDSETPPEENVNGGNVEDEGDVEPEEEETAGISDDPPAEDVNNGDKAETPEEDVEDETDAPIEEADNDGVNPETDPADDGDVAEPEADQPPGGLPVNPANDPSETPVTDPVEDEGTEETPGTPEVPTETVDNPPEVPVENETPVALEEICGDGVDQDGDGVDGFCPEGEETRLKVSILTPEPGDDSVSEIWLDIENVLACGGPGGCQMVGGKSRVNLLNAEAVATTLLDSFLIEETVGHLRFVLGDDSSVVVDGVSHPLSVPGGETAGLKLMWGKKLEAFELNELLLDFDPLANLSHNPGQGYVLRSVMRAQANVTAPFAAGTAVVDPARGGTYEKPGKFRMEVPAGAVDSEGILWETESEVKENAITPKFTLGPDGTHFSAPVKVALNYDPDSIPEGFTEDDLVILHDGEPIATNVDIVSKILEGEISHFSGLQGDVAPSSSPGGSSGADTSPDTSGTADAGTDSGTQTEPVGGQKLVWRGDSGVPATHQPGQTVTITYLLENTGTAPANGFRLVEYGTQLGAGASYPAFTIGVGETVGVQVVNFPVPDFPVTVYFAIQPAGSDTVMGFLPLGTLDFPFNGGGVIPFEQFCNAPDPSIGYAEHVDLGNGSVVMRADVSDSVNTSLSMNGQEQDTESAEGGGIAAETKPDQLENEHEIAAQGVCDISAYLAYLYQTNRSQYFGFLSKINGGCDPGIHEFIGDPVNPSIGNFVHQETDGTVAGTGGTTIRIQRTYNSQAVLWTPASKRRYHPDGSDEVIAEPPQYFGKGWSSVWGEYLLEIDMAPVFEGVQIMYADGHTANFKKDGDSYVSDSPLNNDLVVKEGSEFVLYQNGCECSLESKRFNSDGNLVAITDRNGNETRLIYAGDLLAAIENASGRQIELDLDGEGRITQATLPEGIILEYEYTDEMLTGFVDGRGLRTEYVYDDEGQMTEIVTPKGHSLVQNVYDDEYRVSKQTVGENETYTFEYENDLTKVTDAYGHTTIHHYDEELRLIQLDHPDGTSEFYDYDEDFNRIYYMDQAGAEWHWTYDENGNRLTADGPLGWHREWEYNELNQVVRMTENVDAATVRTTTFEYDERGNLVRFCNPLGDCGAVIYDGKGQPLEMIDFAGNVTRHVFDAEGDLVSVEDAVGALTRFDHDGLGRVAEMTKPMGSMYDYAYDGNSNLTAVEGPLGWRMGFEFDANDLLATKTDPNGGQISYDYNPSDRLVRVVNQMDFHVATYNYGLMNELDGFTDAEGRSWSYEYDEMMRVIHTAGPLDVHFHYDYNPVGRITDFTDAEGMVTRTDYDALYRPVSIIRNYRPAMNPDSDVNVTTSFDYDLVGNVLQANDPEGHVTRFVYDLLGRRTGKTDAEGYEWAYTYDPMGNLEETLNPRGFRSIFRYTPVYRLAEAVNPEGHAASYVYDLDGRVTDKTDPNGVVTHLDYDALGRRIQKIRNARPAWLGDSETNVTTAFDYDLAGNLRFLTNPRGYEAEFVYDPAHRRTDVFDFEDGRTRFFYDKVNNLLKVVDAEGNPTDYVFDDLNRMVERTNAENEVEAYQYDKMGNRTHLIEADGTVTLYGHDGVYRLNSVTQNYRPNLPSNNDTNVLTQYAYDARGLLTQILNANNAATAFDYNKVGRMVRETDPLDNIWTYTYDGMGNRSTRVDAKGDVTEYDYYPDDMLQETRYANGQTVSYSYDPNNNRVNMQDWLGGTQWTYDRLNRVTAQNDPFERNLFYRYDAASNRVDVTYPKGKAVDYTYSPNNWMASMTDPEGGVIRYTRDKVGNILHIENPNLTETAIAYDRVYRVLNLENRQDKGQGLNSAFEYTYNLVGHVTEAVKHYGWRQPETITETYGYDGLHRLSEAVIDPLKNNREAVRMAYQYDAVGNRLSWMSNDDLTTGTPYDGFFRTYAYNAANQLLTVETDMEQDNEDNVTAFEYDPNGNRVNRLVIKRNAIERNTDYGFDPENRLTEVLDSKYNGPNTVETVFTDPVVPEPDMSVFGEEDWNDPLPRGNDKEKGNSGKGNDSGANPAADGVQADSDVDSPAVIGEHQVFGALTSLEYDGGGRRMVKTYDPKVDPNTGVPMGNAGKKRVEYVFDGLDPVVENDMLNGQWENYYRGARGWIATRQRFNSGSQGQMTWYHYNRKGDVAGLTGHNGNSTHNYRYDPYGGVVPAEGNFTDPHNHYTLTGKEYDEDMGLVWFGARHYDAGVGAWMTQDSYRGVLNNPMSLYRYGYVYNDPINHYDWYGFTGIGEILDSFFSKEDNGDKLWVMKEDDPYTDIVREWEPVQDEIEKIKRNVSKNIDYMKNFPRTSENWSPTKDGSYGSGGYGPEVDPNFIWKSIVSSPKGTNPKAAERQYIWYWLFGNETNKLHTSSIGSFHIFATIDEITRSGCKTTVKLNIWMYNSMSKDSFGRFADHPIFEGAEMRYQFLWWNWQEEFIISSSDDTKDIYNINDNGW